ncbi:MAG: [Fe-Fe] hydrogenase large subunit C-terminal domain-containing protein [Christensenella sp.]|uniref:[Fe-Fe] hydrogenase large subunit C-terminal domain-containing protein n=1 Tax=Christensenella sp. TaxID=1935934 RepID=UPI002B21B5A5|nr:[Fe-Fe] hydrogenase large subunit C-terminal domain-containing protein [Christensenella sp.]MEA5002214.1 [Fe-Fe] hydrogenase large subunit C-terminal domain-containing protein [Christensenella sp.]
MATFEEIYQRLLQADIQELSAQEIDRIQKEREGLLELDCLLHPEKQPVIWKFGNCECSPGEQQVCADECAFDAIAPGQDGGIEIDPRVCVGCCACVDHCKDKRLTASKDIMAVLKTLRETKGLVYALVAPAFLGQFEAEVTPAKLRSAFKKMGFDGMIEVALFADILTLKEALEFDHNIMKESDYQLTSCCCPMWIAMIRKIYRELMPHVPGSVSPMVACGRTIKILHPDAVTVFIGPCIAKKAEAREADIAGAVDYVLTFEEVRDMFLALEIDPQNMEESYKDHSSRAGRIYARSGGVSEAVQETVERLNPNREIVMRTQHADGVPACKAMINGILSGEASANFYEGMGCVGGCVGGPKAIIDREEGKNHVDTYGDGATYATPIDNPYVVELLKRLGFETVEDLLSQSDIFTRHFQ